MARVSFSCGGRTTRARTLGSRRTTCGPRSCASSWSLRRRRRRRQSYRAPRPPPHLPRRPPQHPPLSQLAGQRVAANRGNARPAAVTRRLAQHQPPHSPSWWQVHAWRCRAARRTVTSCAVIPDACGRRAPFSLIMGPSATCASPRMETCARMCVTASCGRRQERQESAQQ